MLKMTTKTRHSHTEDLLNRELTFLLTENKVRISQ